MKKYKMTLKIMEEEKIIKCTTFMKTKAKIPTKSTKKKIINK